MLSIKNLHSRRLTDVALGLCSTMFRPCANACDNQCRMRQELIRLRR